MFKMHLGLKFAFGVGVLVAVSCILFAAFFIVAYFVAPCMYAPFFYADYNKARASLEQIEGVRIVDDWQHHDTSLEDCGFMIQIDGSETVQVDFYEGEDWQKRFWHLDGVVMSLPYNTATNSRKNTYLDFKDLESAGVYLGSLSDVLENIDTILKLTRSRPHTPETKATIGEWCYILYDLDSYK
jgi:hypothetical protein